jgi:hypothetical protein
MPSNVICFLQDLPEAKESPMSQVVEEGRRPVHLGVMVRAEQRRELRERAEEEDRSVSAVTRAAIDAYLQRERERRDA